MANPLVTVARFASHHEAHLARGMLETHGVVVTLLDENITRALGSAGKYVGGIRLQVPEEDTGLAIELLGLAGARTEIEPTANDKLVETSTTETTAVGDKRCPLCGAPPRGLLTRLSRTLDCLLSRSPSGQDLTCSLCGNPREE